MPTVDLTDEEFKAVQVALQPIITGIRRDRPAVERLVDGELDDTDLYFLPGELGRAFREGAAGPAAVLEKGRVWLADVKHIETMAAKFNMGVDDDVRPDHHSDLHQRTGGDVPARADYSDVVGPELEGAPER